MPLVKDASFVEDRWRHLADDEALPDKGDVTVTSARWLKERGALAAAPGLRIGVQFPKFTDGRAYSQARLLRQRLGFRGELRATGNVLRDQLLFMQRCGFDSFEVPERAVAEDWLAAFREFDVFYQPAADGRPWLAARRHANEDVATA